jgi:hypothetical protein
LATEPIVPLDPDWPKMSLESEGGADRARREVRDGNGRHPRGADAGVENAPPTLRV